MAFRARDCLRALACGMTLAGETVARESSTDAAMHQMDVNDSALFMDSNNGEIFTREDAKAIEDALKCAICECVWKRRRQASAKHHFPREGIIRRNLRSSRV